MSKFIVSFIVYPSSHVRHYRKGSNCALIRSTSTEKVEFSLHVKRLSFTEAYWFLSTMPFINLLFSRFFFAESPLLMQHFLSIILLFPLLPFHIVTLSLSMLYTQPLSRLVRLIALATLTFIPTMENFKADAQIGIFLIPLTVEPI